MPRNWSLSCRLYPEQRTPLTRLEDRRVHDGWSRNRIFSICQDKLICKIYGMVKNMPYKHHVYFQNFRTLVQSPKKSDPFPSEFWWACPAMIDFKKLSKHHLFNVSFFVWVDNRQLCCPKINYARCHAIPLKKSPPAARDELNLQIQTKAEIM